MYSRFILPIVTLVFSVFFYVVTMSFPVAADPLGPALWPKIILIGMFIIGVLLTLNELRAFKVGKNAVEKDPDGQGENKRVSLIERYRHWLAFVAMILFAFIMRTIGFPLACFMFINAMAYSMGMRSWRVLLLVSAIASGIISYLFMGLLFMPLPMGSGIFRNVSALFRNF